MIPNKVQQAIDESEAVERGVEVRSDTVVSRPGNHTLQIRLTDEEYQRLVVASGDEPASSFARSVLMQSIAEGPTEALRIAGALREALESSGYEITKSGVA